MDTTAAQEEITRKLEPVRRLMDWIIPRLQGDDEDKLTAIEMIAQTLEERHCQGIDDAAWMVEKMVDQTGDKRLAIAADAIRKLAAANRAMSP